MKRAFLQVFMIGVVLSILISPAVPQSTSETEYFVDSRHHVIDLRHKDYKNGIIIFPKSGSPISVKGPEHVDITASGISALITEVQGWSTPLLLATANFTNVMNAIAVDSSDHLHVVYGNRPAFSGDDYPPKDIYYRYYDGVSWSPAVNLGFPDGINLSIDLTVDSQDNLHMVWEGYTPRTLGVYYSTTSGIPKIPLGGSKEVTDATDPEFYRIYIPTRWGGTLTVTTDNGWMELYYPDTSTRIAGPDITLTYSIPFERDGEPVDEHGWYYLKCGGASSYTIYNTFVQTGEASYRPWNFWYWPILPGEGGGPNLYGDGGPLEKYDGAFGTNAKDKEVRSGYGPGSGHCWGGSVASILLNEPNSVLYGGQTFTQEDMEGLVTKLADAGAKELDRVVTGIPSIDENNNALKPKPGPDEIDKYANEIQDGLRHYIRGERMCLQSNLRDSYGENPRAIWNHAIYKYTSTMEESEEGKEDIIKITTTIYANADLFPSDNTIDRIDIYAYKLRYKSDGKVDDKFTEQDWISASRFAPYNLWFIGGSWLDGKGEFYNPYVTKENVEKLGVDFPK